MDRIRTMTPKEIRDIFERKDYSALKRFGQNFLVDDDVISRIRDSILECAGASGLVYEIGPGLGSLTGKLISSGVKVRAFEIDKGFCEYLGAAGFGDSLEVIGGDAMETLFSGGYRPGCLCGNLPYNVGTAMITRILENGIGGFYPDSMVFLLQKEVADKFSAAEGSKNFSSLGILTWLSYECRKLFDVKPSAFFPVPKVMSGLVVFRKKDVPAFDDAERKRNFIKLVRMAFANRRKTMKNNLNLGGIAQAEDVLMKAGIDPTKRADELRVVDFMRLDGVLESGKLAGRDEK